MMVQAIHRSNAMRRDRRVALALILLVALAFRLHNIGFGLPSLYDPDEPIFMIKALELLINGTLNPKWFGHPGSTTIYLLALIDISVVGSGLVVGAWHNVAEFAKAAFADPGLLFVPARTAMAIIGVLTVWLTYLAGRRLHGTAVGLVSALLLAVNGFHITWSQVVRTDIQASMFMLASLLFAFRIAQHGKLKDYLLAGLFGGFAVATKWPSATIFVAILGAAVSRSMTSRETIGWQASAISLAGLFGILGLFIASPYVFLDWPTVLANLSNEARPHHLGHTGHGLLSNGWWYLWHPVRDSVGTPGLLLIFAGFAVSAMRSAASRWALVPAALAFFAMISMQHLIWSRWVLPLLPMLMIFAAAAIVALAEAIVMRAELRRPALAIAVVAALAVVPSVSGAFAAAAERSNDTRQQAARWASEHIPPRSSVVIEHLELSLRDRPWSIRFPLGEAGCVDAKRLLTQGVNYEEVEELRKGSPIVDLGNVAPNRIETCRADYAILTYYALYRAEGALFPRELGNYEKLLAGGRTVALFAPQPGRAGGPTVIVVALRQH
jgi:asparagine N-glycosylation enzyme membrane subunit Stt3